MDYREHLKREFEQARSQEPRRLNLHVDVGPRASIHEIGAVMRGLEQTFTLAEQLGRITARAQAAAFLHASHAPEQWDYLRQADLASIHMRDRGRPSRPTEAELAFLSDLMTQELIGEQGLQPSVVELHYRNPLDVVALISAVLVDPFVKLLTVIRDWDADKARAQAEAKVAVAEADLRVTVLKQLTEQYQQEAFYSSVVPPVTEYRHAIEQAPLDNLNYLLGRAVEWRADEDQGSGANER